MNACRDPASSASRQAGRFTADRLSPEVVQPCNEPIPSRNTVRGVKFGLGALLGSPRRSCRPDGPVEMSARPVDSGAGGADGVSESEPGDRSRALRPLLQISERGLCRSEPSLCLPDGSLVRRRCRLCPTQCLDSYSLRRCGGAPVLVHLRGELEAADDSGDVRALVGECALEHVSGFCEIGLVGDHEEVVLDPASGGAAVEAAVGRRG